MLGTLIVGFVAGALAKFIMPGRDGGGFIITILLGVGGAYAGQTIGEFTGILDNVTRLEFSAGSIASATLGAFVLLLLYRLIFRRSRS